jgi:L-cysteate sulfo-lyase
VSAADVLDTTPRAALAHLPTPLEPADRLTKALGGPRVWIKRDDCTGLATGGNKTRKLEYLLGDPQARGAKAVITLGAVQSNHARQTAAACAKLGIECHLVLSRRVRWSHAEYEVSGNPLLDRLVGATVRICAGADVERIGTELIDRLSREGKRPYLIPTGGSNALGALGYARCAREIASQAAALGFTPDVIVHATSSGGTQAGLVAGCAAFAPATRVLGINVYDRNTDALTARIDALAKETAERLGVRSPAVEIDHRYLGEDYGIPTPATIEAIRLAASLEGLVFDPVYSGKGLSGLIALIRDRALDARNVVFVHTGGVASLPVYSHAFE